MRQERSEVREIATWSSAADADSQRIIEPDTGAARPEAPEAKEPCQKCEPACYIVARRRCGMLADTLERSPSEATRCPAWHVFLPKGPEGDLIS